MRRTEHFTQAKNAPNRCPCGMNSILPPGENKKGGETKEEKKEKSIPKEVTTEKGKKENSQRVKGDGEFQTHGEETFQEDEVQKEKQNGLSHQFCRS